MTFNEKKIPWNCELQCGVECNLDRNMQNSKTCKMTRFEIKSRDMHTLLTGHHHIADTNRLSYCSMIDFYTKQTHELTCVEPEGLTQIGLNKSHLDPQMSFWYLISTYNSIFIEYSPGPFYNFAITSRIKIKEMINYLLSK